MKKISFFIDGKEVTTTEGKTILEAALENGIDIPHFCYHDSLGKDGNCRICLVEIENNPKLVTSCTTPVMEGMKVLANSEHARKGRAGVMEFILLNHPLDCPVCDKAGECILQNYSYDHGYGHSRLEYPKEHFPVKDLGPDIYLWTERCIKCGRCIRFLEDIAETGELGFRKRGVKTELDIFDGVPIDNPVSLNIVDICPVGALLDKDFLYKARVWDLKSTESICPGCSAGCNIKYWSLDNILQRITARSNKGVNDHWLCNEGRRTYKNVDTEDRLVRHSLKGGKTVKLDEALEKLINTCETYKDKEGAGSIVAIGSPYLTNEENYLIKKLFGDNLGAKVSLFPARVSGKDQSFGGGFKIKAEKAPNYKGAQAALGLKNDNFQKIIDEIDKGSIKCVIAFNGDPELNLDASALKALKKAKFISLCEPHPSELNKTADIIFAGNMPAEKDGTFTNDKGITQRIRRAVYKPLDSEPEWQILLELAAQWNQECKAKHPLGIFEKLASEVEYFKGADYEKIGQNGFKHKD